MAQHRRSSPRTSSALSESSDDDSDLQDLGESLQPPNFLDELTRQRDSIVSILEGNRRRISGLLECPLSPQSFGFQESPHSDDDPLPAVGGYADVITKKFLALPDEPPDGIFIAVKEAGLPRFARRFPAESQGDAVYIWVASRPEVIQSGMKYGQFELVSPQKVFLGLSESLAAQKICDRTIFRIRRISV
jgi:hypothetical protein